MKMEPSLAAGTQNRSYSSTISNIISYQLGGVVVVGPHLLPGNFKDYWKKIHCSLQENSLFIVEKLNIIYIDICRHIYSMKGMLYEEK